MRLHFSALVCESLGHRVKSWVCDNSGKVPKHEGDCTRCKKRVIEYEDFDPPLWSFGVGDIG